MKTYHDENLLDFIDKYSSKDAKKVPMLNFYAYNSGFHLQEVNVRYSWIMNDFNSFHMAGIVEKVESDANVILIDEYGNLEGWTSKIGAEELNLDAISISERQKYNILPLFPTLVKYMDSLGVIVRTIFFKTAKVKDSSLIVVDSEAKEPLPAVQEKILQSFRKILRNEEIVGASFAEIEFTRISLCQGRANLRKIVIREYEPVENISELLGIIEKMNTISSYKTEKSVVSCTSLLGGDSERQEFSILS